MGDDRRRDARQEKCLVADVAGMMTLEIDMQRPALRAAITAREQEWALAELHQQLCNRDGGGRFAAAAQREIADTNDGSRRMRALAGHPRAGDRAVEGTEWSKQCAGQAGLAPPEARLTHDSTDIRGAAAANRARARRPSARARHRATRRWCGRNRQHVSGPSDR